MKSTRDNTVNEIRRYCYRLINRRDYTRAELYRKLIARGYPNEDIEAELLRLRDLGFVDDRRAASMLLSHCEGSRYLGVFACKEELRVRGVDREIIDEMVFTDQGEIEKALKIIAKKTRHLKKYPSYVRLNKVYELLSRKGFDNNTITKVINQYKEEEKEE
ncbi:MAG: regulatory protein RecX [Nitrospirae bacterium]|nr:regulatory protein RecX [Nitrospirota bacterium]